MDLYLVIPAERATTVARLKPLAEGREGRARGQISKTVWYDSPDHALRTQGLTLAETRGVWRLERLRPDGETWLPGQPAPVIAEGVTATTMLPVVPDATDSAPADGGGSDVSEEIRPTAGHIAVPSPLAPVAAFEGRRATSTHRLPAGTITLSIESGVLRSVTAEAPVAHILLSGDPSAVRQAALLAATEAAAAIPRASLPAIGIGLATAWEPPARRLGPPILPPDARNLADAFAHIMGHLLDVTLHHAPRLDQGPEAVHQMRVAVRRGRSALSMFRHAFADGALEPMAVPLRMLNAQLGPTRDWDVFTGETLPAVGAALPQDERLARLIAAAGRRRDAHHKDLAAWLAGPDFRVLTVDLAWSIAAGQWRAPAAVATTPSDLRSFAALMLHRRWKQLRSAGKDIEALDIPALHDVRLRAKRLRYAAEMFATLWPGKASHRFIRRLADLQQRLGVLNDGAVASDLLSALGGPGGRHAYAAGAVTGYLAAQAERARPRIVDAFVKFRRQDPYWA